MKISPSLIKKYNVPVPRYTSYPPANFFEGNITQEQYINAIEKSNNDKPENISIYIHIPFCKQQCLYCGCNNIVTNNKELMHKYVQSLKAEMKMVFPMIDHHRKVSQIHWGGGTPNVLSEETVAEIMDLIKQEFQFIKNPEMAIECHPAHLTQKYIEKLSDSGFTRISLGVQDFQEKVLNAVNREIPEIPVAELSKMIHDAGMTDNIDLIYGLPYQTEDSFSKDIDKIIEISPDRLVTFSYAHVPWIKKAQKKLEEYGLPEADEKLKMFGQAWHKMKQAGYIPIGLDHYARPEDPLAQALKNKTLHRNFQGYCTLETTGQVYAFGVTGISQFNGAYIQNIKGIEDYIKAIGENKFLVEKGYFLNNKEKLIRYVIDEIMCNNYLSWTQVSDAFGMTRDEVIKELNFSDDKLLSFKKDDLLDFDENEIKIHDEGRFFLRNIAAVFDPHVNDSVHRYSKAL
ncbi:MAG: oxygen-independent coproporphyrinogen III oxidase [Prolixibacteraceae bacterium]|nr:oxygen-independent coproporphyrinogen III oxidase [Prolixibacteraceae bacterium]